MQLSGIPAKFPLYWAQNASGAWVRNIPVNSQIGVQAGAASLNDGFVPDNGTPIGAGGVPPFEQDMNGILRQISQWVQWQNAGAPVAWDSSFSTSVGGYPLGAIVAAIASGYAWYCNADNNTTDPETGGAGWTLISLTGGLVTGDPLFSLTSAARAGYIIANATTIGSAASGASQLASASAAALYAWHWNNFSNTQCPVTGGRGANPAADFAANKPIKVLDMRGLAPMGADTMGGATTTWWASVPFAAGGGTIPGSIGGENLHSLVPGENGPHAHTYGDTGHTHTSGLVSVTTGGGGWSGTGNLLPTNASSQTGNSVTGITINSQGSGTGHNTVQRSMVCYWLLKL